MKTVRELTDILKVSNVSVYKAIKRDDISRYVIKQGNITYINDIGEQLLIDLFKIRNKILINPC
jgi:CTP-dependent riboflavin kinase